MRMDKPIGIYLLLWPCVWALWIAAQGTPPLFILLVFVAGTIVMRAAGCVINDIADRKIDGAVKRTMQRPLASKELSTKQALGCFLGLALCALFLVLTLNWQTVLLAFGGLALTVSYPFMKRYTHLPQVVLGAAFGWSIPMAFMAINQQLSEVVWYLYAANLCWTVAYDTEYAMVDRDDDLKIGVKSTAILFAQFDKAIIFILQMMTLVLLARVSYLESLSWPVWLALALCFQHFLYQQFLIKDRLRDQCFQAFLHNHWVGLSMAVGIITHYLLQV
jgi:4-hydroxybenzoate polyprenyltransferase